MAAWGARGSMQGCTGGARGVHGGTWGIPEGGMRGYAGADGALTGRVQGGHQEAGRLAD